MAFTLSVQAFTAAHIALSVIGLVSGPFVLRAETAAIAASAALAGRRTLSSRIRDRREW